MPILPQRRGFPTMLGLSSLPMLELVWSRLAQTVYALNISILISIPVWFYYLLTWTWPKRTKPLHQSWQGTNCALSNLWEMSELRKASCLTTGLKLLTKSVCTTHGKCLANQNKTEKHQKQVSIYCQCSYFSFPNSVKIFVIYGDLGWERRKWKKRAQWLDKNGEEGRKK